MRSATPTASTPASRNRVAATRTMRSWLSVLFACEWPIRDAPQPLRLTMRMMYVILHACQDDNHHTDMNSRSSSKAVGWLISDRSRPKTQIKGGPYERARSTRHRHRPADDRGCCPGTESDRGTSARCH